MLGKSFDNLSFIEKISFLAESEFGGTFDSQEGQLLLDEIVSKFSRETGNISFDLNWFRTELKSTFLFIEKKPEWVENPNWPFLNGKPMVFLNQFEVPETEIALKYVSNPVIFLFGSRDSYSKEGWKVEYKIIDQYKDLGQIYRKKRFR